MKKVFKIVRNNEFQASINNIPEYSSSFNNIVWKNTKNFDHIKFINNSFTENIYNNPYNELANPEYTENKFNENETSITKKLINSNIALNSKSGINDGLIIHRSNEFNKDSKLSCYKCFSPKFDSLNILMKCKLCGNLIHKYCYYNIADLNNINLMFGNNNDFICCNLNDLLSGVRETKCGFCFNTDGIMKKLFSGHYHESCFDWLRYFYCEFISLSK